MMGPLGPPPIQVEPKLSAMNDGFFLQMLYIGCFDMQSSLKQSLFTTIVLNTICSDTVKKQLHIDSITSLHFISNGT